MWSLSEEKNLFSEIHNNTEKTNNRKPTLNGKLQEENLPVRQKDPVLLLQVGQDCLSLCLGEGPLNRLKIEREQGRKGKGINKERNETCTKRRKKRRKMGGGPG